MRARLWFFIMRSSRVHSIVWVVVFAVIALLAVTTGSAVAHELQHAAHHGGGMHASGVCSWMCAAADVHVASPVHLTQVFQVIGSVPLASSTIFLTQHNVPSLPRAPPQSV